MDAVKLVNHKNPLLKLRMIKKLKDRANGIFEKTDKTDLDKRLLKGVFHKTISVENNELNIAEVDINDGILASNNPFA